MEVFPRDKCRTILNNYCKDSSFEVVSSELETISGIGGFLSIPKRLLIKSRKFGQEEVLTFFVKVVPQVNDYHSLMVNQYGAFYKECQIYERILPKLSKYIRGKLYPECYYSENNNLIVLEDLSLLGFKTLSVNELYGINECELVLDALAKFHTASIVYEERNESKINEEIPDILFETIYHEDRDHIGNKIVRSSLGVFEALLEKSFPHVSPEIRQKVLQIVDSVPSRLRMPSQRRRVLVHGDTWSNNIMLKMGENGNFTEVRLVDFQVVRYLEPAFDVLLFLYTTASYSLGPEILQSFFKSYYDKLGKELSQAGLVLDRLLPWKEFQESIDEVTPAAVGISLICVHIASLPSNVMEAVMSNFEKMKTFFEGDRKDIVLHEFNTNEFYNRRVSKCLKCLINYAEKH